MATTEQDLRASDVAWDLEPLVDGRGEAGVDELLDEAAVLIDRIVARRGTVGDLDAPGLASLMRDVAAVHDRIGRAGSYAGLRFAVDTADAGRGALMQRVESRSGVLASDLVFLDLEWIAVDDARAAELLADPELAFCAHHLRTVRSSRPHRLGEEAEQVDIQRSLTGVSAWGRLFDELTSATRVDLDGEAAPLELALSRLSNPDRAVRAAAAAAVTAGLEPGLRTRAFVFNTVIADAATTDRLRAFPTWLSARNLANEASDASVEALVDAVVARYDIPQRWYALKARLLGVDRLADYDRSASVAASEAQFGWTEARELVLDAYASYSPELASVAGRFFEEGWIDAPMRAAKRPGAFCAYTVPDVHPFLLLNWTSTRRDVLTLAHELGHGLHAYLARAQGIFHQSTPLTLAETASVFGETVTFGRILDGTTDPADRLALLAENLDGQIATVFRQVAMNRFEDAVHTHHREQGELSVEEFGEHWHATQTAMLGPAVEVTEGYRTWWSYIPHFIHTPGYVYAYAYGQLLALSVYRRYQERGEAFVPAYLDLLARGGSMAPEDLGRLVDCDLADPAFWDGGLRIIAETLELAEQAARDADRI
ncbi:MAG: M3 family oligoendopeptidase [Actinomycetes bacterium]